MSTVCRFYLQGNCKYGSSCRNVHPQGRGGRGGRGQFNYRGGGGQFFRGSGSRHQADPYEDIGRGWDKKGGNRFDAFNDPHRGAPSHGLFADSRQQGRGGRGGGNWRGGSSNWQGGGSNWRGGSSSNWPGGGGNWRGGSSSNWRGGSSSSGGGHWRGDSGGNWRGSSSSSNWRGGGGSSSGGHWRGDSGGNWRGSGGGNWRGSSSSSNWRGGSSGRESNYFQQDRQRSDNSKGWWQGNDQSRDIGRQDSNFFRQGNWQRSDNRFSHQQSKGGWWQGGGGGGLRGSSRGRDDWSSERRASSSYYSGDSQQVPTASDIMKLVKDDMKEWSQSSMWLLSCYTPHKLLPCIPGFEDYSPEEVRWAAYQASATGAGAATHQQALIQLYAQYKDTWQKCSSITIQDANKLTQASSSSLLSTGQPEKDPLFSTPKESLFGDLEPSSPRLMADKPTSAQPQQLFPLPAVPPSPPPPSQSGRVLFQSPSNTLFGPISAPQNQPQQQQQPEGGARETIVDSLRLSLSEEDLAAFRADKFTLGAIPEHAPPTTLCH